MLVGAVVSLLAVAFLSVISVANAEGGRAAALEPLLGAPGASAVRYDSLVEQYQGRRVTLIRIALFGDGAVVVPPGLPHVPTPGEIYVTPALGDRLKSDRTLRRWFSENARFQTVLPPGVASAGEYRAYIGVTAEELVGASSLVGFGVPQSSLTELPRGTYPRLGAVVFLLLPALALAVAGCGTGATVRRHRFRALRLAGVPLGQAALASAVPSVIAGGIGASTSLLMASLLAPARFTVPIAGRMVFRADTSLNVANALVVVILTAGLFGLLTVWSDGRGAWQARHGLWRRMEGRAWIAAIPYSLGLVAGCLALMRSSPRDPLLWISILLLGLGLPGMISVGAAATARVALPKAGSVPVLLAMKQLMSASRSLGRVAGVWGVAVFVLGVAQPVQQVVAQPTPSWVAEARSEHRPNVLGRAETLSAATLELAEPQPAGVQEFVPAIGLWDPSQPLTAPRPRTTAIIANCAQIRTITDQPLAQCQDGVRYRLVSNIGPSPSAPVGDLVVRYDDGTTLGLTVPDRDLIIAPTDMPIDALVMLPPGDPAIAGAARTPVRAAYLRVTADERQWEAARAWIIRGSAGFRLENAYEASVGVDSTGRWVLAGLAVTSIIAFIAAFVVAADRRDGMRRVRPLRLLGVSRGDLLIMTAVRALWLAVVTAGVVGAAVALVVAAYLRVNDEHLSNLLPLLAPLALPVLLPVYDTVVAAWQLQRNDDGGRAGSTIKR